MQLKSSTTSTTVKANATLAKSMASIKDEEQQQSSSSRGSNNNKADTTTNRSNNNNNNSDDNNSANIETNNNTPSDETKLKKQTLEQRKQELEKLLSEKSWLLQQIQKQETQIINGNYEFLNLNDIFANLAKQYKHEQQLQALAKSGAAICAGGGGGGGGGGVGVGVGGVSSGSGNSAHSVDASILRRKHSSNSFCKENHIQNNNRNSELSNRSSEYDNYTPVIGAIDTHSIGVSSLGSVAAAQQQQQLPVKSALKKRATAAATQQAANLNYMHLQRQQQQQLLQQHVDQHYPYTVQQQQQLMQHMHYQQQQRQQFINLQHHTQLQHHAQSQIASPQHHHQQHQQFDAISLYSVNSANVATLRQQHVAPQQQPIIVQCDKYYLSPTHQNYNDGGFIKSSQNIKKYISPLASPTHYELPPQAPQQHMRQLDAISLAPSYASLDAESIQQLRWRSQTHIASTSGAAPLTPPHVVRTTTTTPTDVTKSYSSDMLATPHTHSSSSNSNLSQHFQPSTKPKPLDEISLSSLNSEKKLKSKQWLESSLDGPVIRTGDSTTLQQQQMQQQKPRERAKLSSQSMSASGGRHYSMSGQRTQLQQQQQQQHSASIATAIPIVTTTKLLQNDDGRYAKLSQSTSYLNQMENVAGGISAPYTLEPLDIPPFKYLPPKPIINQQQQQQLTPPPRPPPLEKPQAPLASPIAVAAVSAASAAGGPLSPEIRIESPKNMTVVQQATFQPYKEITKPFEMSDFYKYSTKFRQKEANTSVGGGSGGGGSEVN